MKSNIFFLILVLIGFSKLNAQDTTRRKTIEITSSFKPTLKPSAKINFNPTAVVGDTTRPHLLYSVPVQNLTFTIAPSTLRPAAFQPDTLNHFGNNGYIKAGYGTFSTPYLDGAVSFGDGKKGLGSLYGNYISSSGNKAFQKYSLLNLGGNALLAAGPNTQLKLGAGIRQFATYYYGYQPDTLKFTDSQLRQRYSTFNINASLYNNLPTTFGILYAPTINLYLFNDISDGKETHFNFKAPVEISLFEKFKLGLALQGDIVKYDSKNISVSNNLFSIAATLNWYNDLFVLKAGVLPSWDNSKFSLLPNIEIETRPGVVQTNNATLNQLIFMAGLKGYYDINSYRNMATYNPWIIQPTNIFNTKNTELYAGVKSSSGDHFSYMARIGYVQRSNVALYQNDTTDGKTFKVLQEGQVNSVKLHGELSYQQADQIFLKGSFQYQTFGGFVNYDRAYGLIPLEVNANLRLKILKNFYFNTDLYYTDGTPYKTKKTSGRNPAAFDLNAGFDFKVAKNVSLWLQFNNILNDEYQRFNQYYVLGFQALVGAKVDF